MDLKKIDYNITLADNTKTLWRYMDFTKFIDLLENNSMFFPKIDLFEDKFEGVHNALNEDDFYRFNDGEGSLMIFESGGDQLTAKEKSDRYKKGLAEILDVQKKCFGVSCWRLSDTESHAMWKIFLSANEGIAIKTNIGSLKNSINLKGKQISVFGQVNYIDFKSQKIPVNGIFPALFHKTRYFEHEYEFRVLAGEADYSMNERGEKNMKLLPAEGAGVKVEVNTKELIKEIVVSPYAPYWFFELVKKVAIEKYNIDVPITKSGIELR